MKQIIIPLLYLQIHVNIIGLPVYYCAYHIKKLNKPSLSRFFKTKETFNSLEYQQLTN
jgi:hypothetical protein